MRGIRNDTPVRAGRSPIARQGWEVVFDKEPLKAEESHPAPVQPVRRQEWTETIALHVWYEVLERIHSRGTTIDFRLDDYEPSPSIDSPQITRVGLIANDW